MIDEAVLDKELAYLEMTPPPADVVIRKNEAWHGVHSACHAWTGALRDQQGFPLKVTRVDGAAVMEVTKIEKKALDASMFAPPADYQKLEMPTGAPPPPRPRQ